MSGSALVPSAEPVTERGRRTRASLLEAARQVFDERGYAGLRMQDVAEVAGVSHGTVYTWFSSKDELLRAEVDRITKDVVVTMAARDREAEPFARLLSANRRFLDDFRRHARMLAVVEEAASAEQAWAAVLDGLRQQYVTRARRTIERLRRQGLVANDVVPAAAAVALTGMVETFARRSAHDLDPGEAALQITLLWARAIGLRPPSSIAGADHASDHSVDQPAAQQHPATREGP